MRFSFISPTVFRLRNSPSPSRSWLTNGPPKVPRPAPRTYTRRSSANAYPLSRDVPDTSFSKKDFKEDNASNNRSKSLDKLLDDTTPKSLDNSSLSTLIQDTNNNGTRCKSLDELSDETKPCVTDTDSVSDSDRRSKSYENLVEPEKELTQSTENLIDDRSSSSGTPELSLGVEKNTSKSCDNIMNEQALSDCSESQPGSMMSLPSQDGKRKKNFMDRCYNKVRSFIKK